MPRKSRPRVFRVSELKPTKPYKLRRWIIDTRTGSAGLYTCARPGRTGDAAGKNKQVPDDSVHRWVVGLPIHCGSNVAIVSLLGRKHGPDGDSEFSFYSFCGGFDTSSERGKRPTFQEWVDRYHENLGILVCEHPTYDFAGNNTFPTGTLDAVKTEIEGLISKGHTVVVVDSGGATWTYEVVKHMSAKEDSSNKT